MAMTTPTRPKQKITLRLPAELMETAQEAVRLGLAPSQSAFIEDSLRRRMREVRHAWMRRLAEEAMADPDFVADMRATQREFGAADAGEWPPFDAGTTAGEGA